jgi:hypothetical protein
MNALLEAGGNAPSDPENPKDPENPEENPENSDQGSQDMSDLSPEERKQIAISQLEGEGSFEDFAASTGNDDDMNEGESGQIFEADVDVEDGDLLLSRVDFALSNGTEEPWEYFDAISLWIDGVKIRTQPAGEEKYWREKDEVTATKAAQLNAVGFTNLSAGDEVWGTRFPQIGEVLEDGEEYEIQIVLRAKENVDTTPSLWNMFIDDEGLRAYTAQDFNVYAGDQGRNGIKTFTIEEEGQNEELDISASSDSPDDRTIAVDENNSSDAYSLAIGELEADESDFDVDEVTGEFVSYDSTSSATSTYDNIVDELMLEIGGETFDVDTVGAPTSTDDDGEADGDDRVYEVTFDVDDEVTIEDGEKASVDIFAEFNESDGNYDNGHEVAANITGVDAEGAGDANVTDDVSGDIQTLSVYAIEAEQVDSSDSDTTEIVDIEITAAEEGEDVYIPYDVATSSEEGDDDGFIFDLDYGTTTSATVYNEDELDGVDTDNNNGADDDENGNEFYRVNSGETEEFSVKFVFSSNADRDDDGHAVIEKIQYTDDDDQNITLELTNGIRFEA